MLTQADINQAMRPWGDREFSRFAKRLALFQRRGWDEARAEFVADMLALRDQMRDDRRMCIECSELQRDGGCFQMLQGQIRNATKQHKPVQDILQRCEGFAWAKA